MSAAALVGIEMARWHREHRMTCGCSVEREGLRESHGTLVCGVCDAPVLRRRRVELVPEDARDRAR